jgi:hypothetical protein
MNVLRLLPLLALPSVLAATHSERSLGALHYRVKVQFKGDAAPTEARFVVEPTPVLVTRNRVQKPRLGGWRLEGVQKGPGTISMGALLARVERMLYLSGPAPGVVQRSIAVRFGRRTCPLWQVEAPAGLQVYAYLTEVRPGLLALSYLSGCFAHGDITSLELQLENFALAPGAGPAEEGLALLGTLQRMARESLESKSGGGVEQVPPG